MAWLRAAAVTVRSVGYAQPEFSGQHELVVQGDLILFPRCTRNHWWLAVYETQCSRVSIYNSINATRTTPHTRRDVAVLLEGIASVFGDRPEVVDRDCPQQNDCHSCGVWTARFAAEAAGVPVIWDRATMITDLFPEMDRKESEMEPL
jgi:Ulp1 family protease